jgi:hypothetical protein
MTTARSYKIVVEYSSLNKLNAKTASTLHLTATTADLAVLLHTLNESPSVSTMRVYNTVVIPCLHTQGKLTAGDLGLDGLKKLK